MEVGIVVVDFVIVDCYRSKLRRNSNFRSIFFQTLCMTTVASINLLKTLVLDRPPRHHHYLSMMVVIFRHYFSLLPSLKESRPVLSST